MYSVHPEDKFSDRVKRLLKKSVTSAKRRGAWFSLDRKERGILSLAIRLDIKFSSIELLRAITSVLKKLEEHGDTLYSRIRRGIQMAWAFSDAAVSWGNASAREWRHDRAYADYLGRLYSGARGGLS
ncbi:MAG TPA: hypothetical protein VEC02_07600 [Nitrososphaerales archaeon]|nr:hypothetical protein [Nitrososphaerales archaeon]